MLHQIGAAIIHHNLWMMSAALAFYALLAIFPALSALISAYGLIANPIAVSELLSSLRGILPPQAFGLISEQLFSLIKSAPTNLSLTFGVSLVIALWSAMSGTSLLMQALTIAKGREDHRGILEFYLRAFLLTVALILFGALSLLFVAILPAVLNLLPLPGFWRSTVALAHWPILAAVGIVGIAIIYRFAPPKGAEEGGWITPGAIAATLLWMLGSAGFSFYVAHFPYNRTYGSLGAVVVLLLWFYLTAFIILAGAEIDVALMPRDTTPPA